MAQLNFIVGDLKGNADKIISYVQKIEEYIHKYKSFDQSHCIVFSELALAGYPPLDLLDFFSFFHDHEIELSRVLSEVKTFPGIIIIGAIEENKGKGKNLFNTALVIESGKIVYRYRKQLLPTYDVFDEARYFEPGNETGIFNFNGNRIGLLICEDIWFENKSYSKKPVEDLFKANADLIISINASPSVINKRRVRERIVSDNAKKYGIPIVYVNQVGANDSIVFDGNSFVTDQNGNICLRAGSYSEQCVESVFVGGIPVQDDFLSKDDRRPINKDNPGKFFYEQIKNGIHDYFSKLGCFKGIVIGSSGGIDSAVAIAMAADAIGPDKVFAVTMPSEYSSIGSVTDSEKLCSNLGVELKNLPIKGIFEKVFTDFLFAVGDLPDADLTRQNMQARIRGLLLMAFSNQFGYLLVSTGNKSEMSVGYCVHGDSYIFTDNGIISARSVFDEKNSYSIKDMPVTHSFRNVKNRFIKITNILGDIIKISEDHKIKIHKNGKEEFIEAKNLKVGDMSIVSFGENIWGRSTDITFSYKKKEFDYISQDINFPSHLNENLSKFIGICVADGSYSGINDSIYRIRTSKKYVSDFCVMFFKSIRLKESSYKVTKKDQRGCFFIEICSVQFNSFLRHLGIEHGSHNKDVPACIMRAPLNLVKPFIEGVFLDSTSNGNKNTSEILYHSVSYKLVEKLHLILLNLGVVSYIRSRKNLHEVYIPAIESEKLLNFKILKKSIANRLYNNTKNTKKIKTSYDVVPITHCELSHIKDNTHWKVNGTIRRHLNKNSKWIGRSILKKFLDTIKNKSDITVALEDRIKSKTYYAAIKKLETVETEVEMFDFTVEKDHEYTVNGVKTHNCTIYGDMNGGLAPLSDLYKMEVYELARYYNEFHNKELIPESIINKAPSAELAPGQEDTDNLPPYPLLDARLKVFIEGREAYREDWAEILRVQNQMSASDYHQIGRMVRRNEFKRNQAPITLKIHEKAFGIGRRIPIVQKWQG